MIVLNVLGGGRIAVSAETCTVEECEDGAGKTVVLVRTVGLQHWVAGTFDEIVAQLSSPKLAAQGAAMADEFLVFGETVREAIEKDRAERGYPEDSKLDCGCVEGLRICTIMHCGGHAYRKQRRP